jgi:serine/threonine protein kinase/tetratricopeptide (TPR) repeat protein
MNDLTARDESALEALAARLADEYAERLARGEQPCAEEYVQRYPDHADVIRNLFASLRLLRQSGGSPPGRAAGELQAECPLGDFRLVREVGRGGMGVVYEAVQLSLGRRVALKVLPFAAALDAQQLQRFRNEAHAAAQLQHPHIVPVYAVGCERGVHYYAMQFVEGQTLAALIGQLRDRSQPAEATAPVVSPSQAEGTTQDLAATWTERAVRDPAHYRLVAHVGVQAAEALEHAHRLGVVHRDIKPANLLLDGAGQVWVTDFGLARLSGDPGLTRTGDLVGTLRYMSPEQTEGKHAPLDHRTDVYSLGATLYELLTLRPAFDGRTRQEALRQILTEEPKPPRRLYPGIPADLETVVLKALEKTPADRYATAGALAEDLRRFLADEPVRARRPTLAQRLRRWGRRHQPLVWSATVFGLLGTGGVAAGLVWLAHDQAAREVAALAQQVTLAREIDAALTEARRLREQARGSRDVAVWAQALAMARRAEALAERGPVDPGQAEQVRTLLHELGEEEKDQRLLAALDAARLAQTATDVANNRFTFERALPLYREGLRAYGLSVGEPPAAEAAAWIQARPAAVREALVAALDEWIVLAEGPRRQVPEPHLDWLRAVVEAADPDGWGKVYRTALAEKDEAQRRAALEQLAGTIDVRQLPAQLLSTLAWRLQKAGAGASAVGLLRRAQEAYPGDFMINQRLGMALHNQRPADLGGAARFLTAAVALRPDSPGAYLNLGLVLADQGKTDEAIAAYRRALALDPTYAMAYVCLGVALMKQGKSEEALTDLGRAVQLAPQLPEARYQRGRAYEFLGRWEEAIADYSEVTERLGGFADAQRRRAYANSILGRWDKAAADLAPQGVGAVPPGDDVWFQLACLRLLQGDASGYQELCRQLLDRISQTKEGFVGQGAFVASRTCALHPAGGAPPAQAVLWAEKVVASGARAPWHLHSLALAHYRAGQLEQAVRRSQESLKADPRWGGAVLNWLQLALAYQRLGQPEEARAWMDKVVAWRLRAPHGASGKGEVPTPPITSLSDWLEVQVLYPEAEALLKAASGP